MSSVQWDRLLQNSCIFPGLDPLITSRFMTSPIQAFIISLVFPHSLLRMFLALLYHSVLNARPSISDCTLGYSNSFRYPNFDADGKLVETISASKVFQKDNHSENFPLNLVMESFGNFTFFTRFSLEFSTFDSQAFSNFICCCRITSWCSNSRLRSSSLCLRSSSIPTFSISICFSVSALIALRLVFSKYTHANSCLSYAQVLINLLPIHMCFITLRLFWMRRYQVIILRCRFLLISMTIYK